MESDVTESIEFPVTLKTYNSPFSSMETYLTYPPLTLSKITFEAFTPFTEIVSKSSRESPLYTADPILS